VEQDSDNYVQFVGDAGVIISHFAKACGNLFIVIRRKWELFSLRHLTLNAKISVILPTASWYAAQLEHDSDNYVIGETA